MAWHPDSFMDRLDPSAATALLALGRRRRLVRGETVFVEGEIADRVAVVVDGRLKLVTVSAEGVDAVLGWCGAGHLVGEVSVLDRSPRSATATAAQASEVLIVAAGAFEEFLADHGEAALVLLRQLCAHVRTSNETRLDLSGPTVAVRLVRRLGALADEHGVVDSAGGIQIDLPLSQDELGSSVGASREAVTRALSDLRRAGIVSTARRRIVIEDPDELRRLAGMR